jgi:TonB family protein
MTHVGTLGQPRSPSLLFLIFGSVVAHAFAILLAIILPGILPHSRPKPFGGPSGSGGLNVMTVDLGMGSQGKRSATPVNQMEPAPALRIAKTKPEEEPEITSKLTLPDPNPKKKPKDEPTATSTLNQSKRKSEGVFGTGTDTKKDSGKSGNEGHGKSGVGAVGSGENGPGGSGTGTGVEFPFPWYVEQVLTKLQISWVKPYLGNVESKEYAATVYFVIERNGQVSEVKIEQSSGIESLDRSVQSAVYGAAPFGPLPPQWTESTLAFRIRFTHTP